MKILIVSQFYFPERFRITDTAETLAKLGHDVTVLTGLPNYPSGKIEQRYQRGRNRRETINGVKVIRSWIITRGNSNFKLILNYTSFAFAASLLAAKLPRDFDVVFVYQPGQITQGIPAVIYKKLSGKKILHYSLDLWPENVLIVGKVSRQTQLYKLINYISRKVYQRSDRVLVTTKTFGPHLVKKHRLKTSIMSYLPQYEDNEKLFLSLPERKRKAKDPINITYFGSVNHAQGLEFLIAAIREAQDLTQVKWHIIGDGSMREKMMKMVEAEKIPNITFYGHAPMKQIEKIFKETDACILTLRTDPDFPDVLPGRIQTYLASGRPIIASIDGAGAQVIKDSGAGLRAKSGDYKGLAKLVRRFIREEKKWQKLGKRGRDYYLKNFSKDAHINKLVLELENLAKSSK